MNEMITFEEFEKIVEINTRFEKKSNNSAWIFLPVTIFLLLFLNPFKTNVYWKYSWWLFMIILPALSMYLSSRKLKAQIIPSNLELLQKQALISSLLSEFAENNRGMSGNYIVCTLKSRWWQSQDSLHIFYDQYRLAFLLTAEDYSGSLPGIVRLEHIRKKMIRRIRSLLNEQYQS